jgi:cell division protein FtsB
MVGGPFRQLRSTRRRLADTFARARRHLTMVGQVIQAGLEDFNTLVLGVKSLAGTDGKQLRRQVQAQLVRQILGLQRRITAVMRENEVLSERVRALEARVAQLGTTNAERTRYELRKLETDVLVYMLKPKERGTEPAHWVCPTCFQKGEISIFQRTVRASRGVLYRCLKCNGHVIARRQPAWFDASVDKAATRRAKR